MENFAHDSNKSLQNDEIEALSSIYGEEWEVLNSDENSFCININDGDINKTVLLQVTLPPTYPVESAPVYQISAPWMDRSSKCHLIAGMEDIYCSHIGESILYMWIEKIRECIANLPSSTGTSETELSSSTDLILEESDFKNLAKEIMVDEQPSIEHGEIITDRRSIFQAHLAPVFCEEQVKQVLSRLKENRKIATATHNIVAYRISASTNRTFYQDSDDDGEYKAGSILLHLLQILNASNVVVIVTRWYGGIHLGSDRFKHISNAARNLLEKCGYIKNQKPRSGKTKKKKRSPTRKN